MGNALDVRARQCGRKSGGFRTAGVAPGGTPLLDQMDRLRDRGVFLGARRASYRLYHGLAGISYARLYGRLLRASCPGARDLQDRLTVLSGAASSKPRRSLLLGIG